jgi:hypothetical protein
MQLSFFELVIWIAVAGVVVWAIGLLQRKLRK